MSARDELAEMESRSELVQQIQGGLNNGVAEYIADGLIAAGYVKHRKVYTTADLEELPESSVVVDRMGTVTHQIGRGMWTMGGDEYTADEMTADWLTLPATVLYEPQP